MRAAVLFIVLVLATLVGRTGIAGADDAAFSTPAGRPNVILCMTDDQGWSDVSYNEQGHLADGAFKTTELDAMPADKPDGGLFTQDQIPKGDGDPLQGGKPARGFIEAKPLGDDLGKLVKGKQVARYWKEHQQVLATNFREFALIGRDEHGNPARFEFFRLAASGGN